MRNLSYSGVGALLFLGLCSTFCTAQGCSAEYSQMQVHCEGPGGCVDDVYPWYPVDPNQYGTVVVCTGLNCCGQLISSCGTNGSGCDAVMKKPGVKAAIDRLAATSDLLIADC